MIMFESRLTTFVVLFGVAGKVAKNGLSLKPKHPNQVELVQIPDSQCTINVRKHGGEKKNILSSFLN